MTIRRILPGAGSGSVDWYIGPEGDSDNLIASLGDIRGATHLFDSDANGVVRAPTVGQFQGGSNYYIGADNVWYHVSHTHDSDGLATVRPTIHVYPSRYSRNHADIEQARGDLAIVRGNIDRRFIGGATPSTNISVVRTAANTYTVNNVTQAIVDRYLQPGLTISDAPGTAEHLLTITGVTYTSGTSATITANDDSHYITEQDAAVETERLNEFRGTYVFDSELHDGNTQKYHQYK